MQDPGIQARYNSSNQSSKQRSDVGRLVTRSDVDNLINASTRSVEEALAEAGGAVSDMASSNAGSNSNQSSKSRPVGGAAPGGNLITGQPKDSLASIIAANHMRDPSQNGEGKVVGARSWNASSPNKSGADSGASSKEKTYVTNMSASLQMSVLHGQAERDLAANGIQVANGESAKSLSKISLTFTNKLVPKQNPAPAGAGSRPMTSGQQANLEAKKNGTQAPTPEPTVPRKDMKIAAVAQSEQDEITGRPSAPMQKTKENFFSSFDAVDVVSSPHLAPVEEATAEARKIK